MTATVMRASVLTATARIEMQERPVPSPATDEVLVLVASVGVCGSDVHYYRHGRIGPMVVESPLVLGHEVGGTIVETGAAVDSSRVGQRVALEPQRPCRRCRACKTGHLNLCLRMEFFATPPIDGSFCDYVVVPADFAHPVPDSMSDAAVALCEPLSVGLWANQKGRTAAGSRVFITGAGPIGAVVALAARAMGATEIIVSDPVESRRRRIEALVGASTVDPSAGFDAAEVGADVFLECSGATPALRDGFKAVRSGGVAVLVGHGEEEVKIPLLDLQIREVTVTGIFRYVDTWPIAISLASTGRVDLDALVTARFDLEDTEAALTSDDDPMSMKSVVVVNEGSA
ncbi:MAG: NAD(P)-dependent alcohol dehydrogenase [bacterium]